MRQFGKYIVCNGLRLCEVAVNRSGKFRFSRHVAKANFYLAKLKKKANKIGFCGIRRRNVQFTENPAILQNPCYQHTLLVIMVFGRLVVRLLGSSFAFFCLALCVGKNANVLP